MQDSGLQMYKSFPVMKAAFRKVKDMWQEMLGGGNLPRIRWSKCISGHKKANPEDSGKNVVISWPER